MSTSPSAYAEFAGSKKRAKIRQIKTRDAVLWGASQKTKKIVRLVLGQLQEFVIVSGASGGGQTEAICLD